MSGALNALSLEPLLKKAMSEIRRFFADQNASNKELLNTMQRIAMLLENRQIPWRQIVQQISHRPVTPQPDLLSFVQFQSAGLLHFHHCMRNSLCI